LTKTIEIVETREQVVALNDSQVLQLNRLSRDLASAKSWWGSESGEERERRVINVNPAGPEAYRIVVRDCVGVISLPDLKIIVRPKIAEKHFTYIASYALFGDPNTINSSVDLAAGDNFHELVIAWFLEEVGSINARGLQTDYEYKHSNLSYIRGRTNAIATYKNISEGRLEIDSEYEELGTNTPSNRIIATALRLADFSAIPNSQIQRLGHKLRSSFSEIPSASIDDLKIHGSQIEKRYKLALQFAVSILKSSGRALSEGDSGSKTFLVRTPSLIEEGIRNILTQGLKPISVIKKGKTLNTGMKVMPDLTIARPPFTADIKYKNRSDLWGRADLAQGVFFAEAFKSPIAAIVSFSKSSDQLPAVQVGNIRVESIDWDLRCDSPGEAASRMVEAFASWLPESEVKYAFPLGWGK
jgi:5-methylcytosine-specific restriction enzyme subunit McrC